MRLGVSAALMLMATAATTTATMGTAAWADDPTRLAVVSYGKIPAGASFETELFQNTEISNHVDSTLKDALTAHGFRYDQNVRKNDNCVHSQCSKRLHRNLSRQFRRLAYLKKGVLRADGLIFR